MLLTFLAGAVGILHRERAPADVPAGSFRVARKAQANARA
jgi:hypothetical protein